MFRQLHTLIFAFLCSLFIGVMPLAAQDESRYYNITADEGLSQSFVNCIYQDKQGFMWFGTQDGLNKYDGNGITIFKNNPIDSNTILANNITCLYEDSLGILWIGTDGGLSALNTYSGKFTSYLHTSSKSSISGNAIHAIYQDHEGELWIGTNNNALNNFDRKTGTFKSYLLSPGDTSENNFISSITQDKYGSLWLGSSGTGLFSFNKKDHSYKNYQHRHSDGTLMHLFNSRTSAILYIKETGELYLGSTGGGMEIFNIDSRSFTQDYVSGEAAKNLYPSEINDIKEDAKEDILVACGEGLLKFNKTQGRFYSYKGIKGSVLSFASTNCNSILLANDGIMWVGSNKCVTYYVPERRNFVSYVDTLRPTANTVMAITRDADGKLWIGTNGEGLYTFDESLRQYSFNKPLNSAILNKSVLSLYTDKRNVIWIGTWGSGFFSYNPISGQIIRPDSTDHSVSQSTVTCITQDDKDRLWVGTYGNGICIYNTKTGAMEHLNTGISDNNIYCLFEDREHNMWIGTDGGGVNCYNISDGKNTVIKKTTGSNTLSSNSVNCIYEDTKGNIWIGTSAGLNQYVPSTHKITNYFEKDGLPNNYIYCIVPDNEDNLWISTNKGISKFSPDQASHGASAFKNYDKTDGVGETEFNQGASFKTPDGRIFFGGLNGIVSFHPEKVIGNTHIPPVYITSCELFGKEYITDTLISGKKSLKFLWKDNTLSFSFAGLDYEIPSKNRYSYILEGADKDWSLPTTRHFASYAQLPPGEYIFRVRACNNDGVWNDTGASIYITIVPPFWRTTWFYVTCVVLALGFVIGYTRYRTSRIENEKKILEAKVEERTHELAQRTHELAEKNHDITSSIEYAKRIQQAILPPIEEIQKHLPGTFILYRPKDIVSGDFYWFGVKENKIIIVAADCTGHGVPGALMSMIGHNLLNQIVLEQAITEPGKILTQLNTMVQTVLKQGTSTIDTTDGMDMALCTINKASGELQFAGAYRPLIIAGKDALTKVDPDKKPIGGSQMGLERSFKTNTYKLQKGDTIYMFSDGYADQFGGPHMKKYMLRRFMDNLLKIKDLDIKKQELNLLDELIKWQGNNEQVDDILVIGITFS